MPVAPGTWGSLLAALIWAAGAAMFPSETYGSWNMVVATLIGTAGASAICIGFGDYAIEQWRRKDPSRVVIDEVAGQWLSLLPLAFVPVYVNSHINMTFVLGVIASFVFFRVSDVIKPPPARQAERLPAGIGILTDDLLAGIYAALATAAVIWLLG